MDVTQLLQRHNFSGGDWQVQVVSAISHESLSKRTVACVNLSIDLDATVFWDHL